MSSDSDSINPEESKWPKIEGYEIEALIGRGGMGKVYRGRDTKLGRRVAIKFLIDSGDPQVRQRFDEEARAASRLQHPNIAQLFEFRSKCDPPYFIMELLNGGTLADVCLNKVLEANFAASIMATLARAMDYAHQNDIVHRDLKPSNILIGESKRDDSSAASFRTITPHSTDRKKTLDLSQLKIADFGLAKQMSSDSNLTKTGEIVGTPNYMSPEQASGIMSRVGPATDIYSLGAILYELLTGRPPFVAADSVQTIMMVLADEPIPLRNLNSNLPTDLQTICLKCLEKKGSKRYRTAMELAEDLERFLRREPILARPISRVERCIKWARRRPWQAIAAGLLCFSFVGTFVALLVIQNAYLNAREINKKLADANRSLERANNAATSAYQLTQESMDRIVDRVRNELFEIPNAGPLTLRTVQDSVELNRRLLLLQPESILATRRLITAIDIYRLTEWSMGAMQKYDEATHVMTQVVEQALQKFPDDTYIQSQHLKIELEALGQLPPAEQAARIDELDKQLNRIMTQNPNDPEILKSASGLAGISVNRAVTAQDVEAVLRFSRQRVQYSRGYFEFAPIETKPIAAEWFIQALLSEAEYCAIAKDSSSMNELIAEAKRTFDAIPETMQTARSARNSLARIYLMQGKSAKASENWEEANNAFGKASERFQAILDNFPDDHATTTSLAEALLLRSVALAKLDRNSEAGEVLDHASRLLEIVSQKLPDDYLTGMLKAAVQKVRQELDARLKPE